MAKTFEELYDYPMPEEAEDAEYFIDIDWSAGNQAGEIRVRLPLRIIWLCGRHEHCFRLTAWLCGWWQRIRS